MPFVKPDYKAPKWLPGPHLQTVVPARLFPVPKIEYRRELVDMPDGDFMVFDWAVPEPADPMAPVLVHFHGLEGASDSHYAKALMNRAAAKGWRGVVAHFRGCGGLLNRLPRAYFAGDSADCSWALQTVRGRFPGASMYAVGVSLGGNQLAKYLGDFGRDAGFLTAAVSASTPVDLVAGSEVMLRGVNRLYANMFLSTLKEKLLKKVEQFPGLFDADKARQCSTLYDFDSIYTAPVHGFKNAMQYWTDCSAKYYLNKVQVPLLLLNARNDPFLPRWALPGEKEVSPDVWLDQPEEGGHVGFPQGRPPGNIRYFPDRVFRFFDDVTR